MFLKDLGGPISGRFAVTGGEVRLHERGMTFFTELGESTLHFDLPSLGVPRIATGAAAAAAVLEAPAISFQIGGHTLERFAEMVRSAIAARVALLATGQPAAPTPLTLGEPVVVKGAASGVQATHGMAATASLQERTLYDVSVRRDDGTWLAIAPHALYYRSSWNDFGIAHATDLHVARRIDYFAPRLAAAGLAEAAERMVNFNDRFRGFVRYANYLHDRGLLDVILATGDVVDYLFEDDDAEPDGNAAFMRSLILGQQASERMPDVEELRVPIFMTAGNHDYRRYPYALVAALDVGVNVHMSEQYSGYALDLQEANIAQGRPPGSDVPSLSADTLRRSLVFDPDVTSFRIHLAEQLTYVVKLGPHRVWMLDSGHDIELPTSSTDAVLTVLNRAPEGMGVAYGNSPNSRGVTGDMLRDVVDTLDKTPDEGLFIVGIHAPLFNIWGGEHPYFLRESQRAAQEYHAASWVGRQCQGGVFDLRADTRRQFPSFFGPDGSNPIYVKRGSPSELMDFGVSKGASHELLRALAGIGQRRRADVVLQGHIHHYNEFRLGTEGDEVAYYTDFYTGNLASYYATRFVSQWKGAEPPLHAETAVAHVEFATDAPNGNLPSDVPVPAGFKYVVSVPPYRAPLSSAPDPAAWWAHHRPLVLQTEALGPVANRTTSLNGFRLITVKAGVIQRIDFVSMETLHAANYRIGWEEVIKPDPLRTIMHAQRSREFDAPRPAGDPCGFAVNGQDIVYADSQGRLYELWRDPQGRRGTGELTAALNTQERAGGRPSSFVEPGSGKVVVTYRGRDGHVHSLYWSPTEKPGHDALSRSAPGAPPTDSTPVGYYNPANRRTHVIYRAGDRLQSLSWVANGDIAYENLTTGADAVGAQGDPAPYLSGQVNVVVYRAVDNHIRSIYWTEGASRLNDLSGVAGSPADGNPCAYYVATERLNQVYYRDHDGQILELWWIGDNPVSLHNVSVAAGAPPAASDPWGWHNAVANRKHVVYRGVDGRLHDLTWTPGGAVRHVDLSTESWGVRPQGRPFGFAGTTHQHVVYHGVDNQVHELRWQEGSAFVTVIGTLGDWVVMR